VLKTNSVHCSLQPLNILAQDIDWLGHIQGSSCADGQNQCCEAGVVVTNIPSMESKATGGDVIIIRACVGYHHVLISIICVCAKYSSHACIVLQALL